MNDRAQLVELHRLGRRFPPKLVDDLETGLLEPLDQAFALILFEGDVILRDLEPNQLLPP